MKRKFFWILFFLLLGFVGVYFYFAEGENPSIFLEPQRKFVNQNTKIKVIAKDLKSGIREVKVFLLQKGIKIKVFSTKVSGHIFSSEFSLKPYVLEEGSFIVDVEVRDRSWRNFFKGNISSLQKTYVLDNTPPSINLINYNRYVYQGGTGIVRFYSTEPLSVVGVRVGDYVFPAYPYKKGYICFYTFPYNLSPLMFHPKIFAVDKALNKSELSIPCIVKKRYFPREKINISLKFLNQKIVQFKRYFPEEIDLLKLFLKVNRDLRKRCREKLVEICKNSIREILWKGAFLRQPNSKRMSGFGVKRSYFYEGKKIDEQTHLGIDLASIARAKIVASNYGRVVFAGFLGIYGKSVIIDHGFGLFTLYGHLSSVMVKKGDYVKKGEIIGYSGQTGLAGGDHLHFAVLISGIPANPIEWWDISWIKNNILHNLN